MFSHDPGVLAGPTTPPATPVVPEPGIVAGRVSETVGERSRGVQVSGGLTAGFDFGNCPDNAASRRSLFCTAASAC